MEMTRRQWLTGVGASLAAGGLARVGGRELSRLTSPGGRQWSHPEPARVALQRRHLPNVRLVTHQGLDVRFYDDLVKDRKVLVNFVDTRGPTASTVTSNLAVLQRLLRTRVGGRGDIHMYSITSNPRNDTPEVLSAWAAQHGVRPGWLFLTGEPAEVQRLRRALGIAYTNPAEDQNSAFVSAILKHGVEPEMRWAHCPSQADPRQMALRIVSDFGPDPAVPRPPGWFCNNATVAPLT